VAMIDKNGFRHLTRKEIIYKYECFRDKIASEFNRITGISKEKIKALYPEP
jgi:hypothetical protein